MVVFGAKENSWELSWIFITAVFCSAFLLFVANLGEVLRILAGGDKEAVNSITAGLGNIVSQNLQRLDSLPLASVIVVSLFWMMVGLIVYFCIISIISFIVTLKAERTMVDRYVLPVFVTRKSFAAHIFLNWALLSMIVLISTFYLLLALSIGVPFAMQLFDAGINGGGVERWISLLAGPILGGVLFTIAVILYRLLLSAGRVVFLR